MILDLKKVFLTENESVSVQEEFVLSEMENFVTPVTAAVTVENHAGMIVLEAAVRFVYRAPCDRCGQPVSKKNAYQFRHILVSELPEDDGNDYIQAPDYKLDTVSLLRDDILLELPSKFLCKESCKGLCSKCGKNLNEGACSCEAKEIDPRLAVLKQLLSE